MIGDFSVHCVAKYSCPTFSEERDLTQEYRLTFRLSADLAGALMRYAVNKDVSLSAAVRDAIAKLKAELSRGSDAPRSVAAL
jgi:hypothetical protein